MFLPEDLLFKQGALAHVWLASNQQKKLTKAQVLQHKIPESCEVIIRPEVAAGGPLALRLNAQLLLGEVRIYHKKAHYLQDDCNEALWKIKMAFRPGNIDLPAQTHVANPTNLILPDQITDLDLLAPMPDPSFLLSQPLSGNLDLGNTTVPDWDNSQFLSGSIEQPRMEPMELPDDDLNLDIGEGDDLDPPAPFDEGTSIEMGRNAPLERRQSEEFTGLDKGLQIDDDDLGIDLGEDPPTELAPAPEFNLGDDMDITMGGMTETDLPAGSIAGDLPMRQREESPLSELGEEEATRLEQEVAEQTTMFEPEQEQEEEESIHQARAKRRRVIGADAETMISSHQLREQQNNRDKILKSASFLPRDPLLMALLNMQKSGGFVSSILGDGRSQGWAPELRGILSLEVISRPSQKRKRDGANIEASAEEDEATAAEREKTPQLQLEFEQDEPSLGGGDIGIGGDNTMLGGSDDIIQLPDEPGFQQVGDDEDDAFSPVPDNFDDTTAPLVHPAEAGPVSLGTKHAVHFLREQFGPEAEESESERQKNSIVFQDVFPETRTSRTDATKMFFEMLVLATKDAIKVEQPANELGGPLRIRAKRGLWGQWAETGASGELTSQAQAAPSGDADAPAEAMFQGPPEVSVSA
ncbi:double-strand-break repair protein rad21 [Stemphylium lycopersici]|uniref:Double-strand-break repair protein rad21 n=1 Tax=Stemphylium lycopersici TaxID=183478 RepID=A0A364N2G4_STELY|nr:double-strand-break repair protein rad21 [Stemphylium lycopersici]RAR02245.1 double-strand-break repair protein rad21 [Stemphylium lycopersici]RAR09983.1 double-strand-break repair protein rad21 [Stemphylium lycopersici]